MRARSWMAALALIAGTSIAVGRTLPRSSPTESQGERQPQDAGPSGSQAKSQTSDKKPLDPPIKSVQLNLVIAGLGREGCDVEVMPGNPSCKFRVVNLAGDAGKLNRGKEGAQHVSSAGRAVLELQNVEIRGADRTCAVKIIMHESGQSPKTVYRGFRVPHRDAEATAPSDQTPSFTCYLSSPSKVANAGPSRTRK